MSFLLEVCIDSIESAKNAIDGGASRLEVCSSLSEGGLTPSLGLVKYIKSYSSIPIFVMIRIRSGNFVYNAEEMDAMLYDLEILKKHNVDGFVFGALTTNYKIDVESCRRVLNAASPLPVTFHRAFDEVEDPYESTNALIDLGFQRILTSGQRSSAEEGLELVTKLVTFANNRIAIMPGAGVTKDNILKIKRTSGAKEFHASCKTSKRSYEKLPKGVTVGTETTMVTDRDVVRQITISLTRVGESCKSRSIE